MAFNFGKMIVTFILYLILPSLFCAPLNRHSYAKQLKSYKNFHSAKEKLQIEEKVSVHQRSPLNKKTSSDENNMRDVFNDDQDSEVNNYTTSPDNIEIIAKGVRKFTTRNRPESSSNIYVYFNGTLNKERTSWRWYCLYLFVLIMGLVILLSCFHYNFDLGFYCATPERTELLSDSEAIFNSHLF